jgi:hypothetical protein
MAAAILVAQTLINAPLGFSIIILTLLIIDALFLWGILTHYRKELMRNPYLLIKYRWWFVSDFLFIFIGLAITIFLWSFPNALSFVVLFIWIIIILLDIWFDSILIEL